MFVAGRLISRNFKNLYSNLNNLIFSLFFFFFIKISYRWLTIEIIDNFEMNSFEGNVIIYSFEIYIILCYHHVRIKKLMTRKQYIENMILSNEEYEMDICV